MEDFEAMVVMETYCWQPLHDRLEEGDDMEQLGWGYDRFLERQSGKQ